MSLVAPHSDLERGGEGGGGGGRVREILGTSSAMLPFVLLVLFSIMTCQLLYLFIV